MLRAAHLICAAVAAALLAAVCPAQDARPAPAEPPPVKAEDLREQRQAVEARSELDEAVKKTTLELYDEALSHLSAADAAASRAAEFARLIREAPSVLESIQSELASPPAQPSPQPPPDATLAQLEQALAQAMADLEAARRQSDEVQGEQARRSDRRAAITEQLAQLRTQLKETEDKLAGAADPAEPPETAQARRALLQARRQAIAREIEALEQEGASYEARRELLPARRDRALRRVAESQQLVAAWQEIVNEARRLETQRAAQEAARLSREAARKAPALQEFATTNEELVARRAGPQGLDARIASADRQLTEVTAQLASLRESFRETRERMGNYGLNRATGLRLRREYDALPEPSGLYRAAAALEDEIAESQYQLDVLDEQRAEAGQIDAQVQRLLTAARQQAPEVDAAELEAVARELAVARRELLDRLTSSTSRLSEKLEQLAQQTRTLAESTAAYRSYIGERILWVRSVSGQAAPNPREALEAAHWLVSPAGWTRAAQDIWASVLSRPGLGLVGLVTLLSVRRWARQRIEAIAPKVTSFRTDSFGLTLKTAGLTLLLAAPAPGVLLLLAWILGKSSEPVASAMASGMAAGALLLALAETLRQTLRPRGLGQAHFRWPEGPSRAVRANLRWFTPVALPPLIIARAMDAQEKDLWNDALGRIALAILLLALAVLSLRLLRPTGAVLKPFFTRHAGGWLHRLRYLWYPAIVGLPLALLATSMAGYHYTALRLELRLEITLALLLLLVLVNGLMQRWLFVARRRLAVEDARRRRAQQQTESGGEGEAAPIEEDKLNLPAISAQTRQLFRSAIAVSLVAGLWLAWADVLPALRVLDRIQIWPSVAVLSAPGENDGAGVVLTQAEQPAPAEGAPAQPTGAAPIPALTPPAEGEQAPVEGLPSTVTVADIGLAIVAGLLTYILVRNLPALVEIMLLQRLPLDAGSRYALGAVLRYTVAIIGIAVALSAIGISWSKVQWLAAALTFGLAFGLQEIFANFISGLIILAERPIRVGDTVTVGNVSGTVTRIRMRATTICDWDRKELVIPNKTFITDQVINWTLSDPVLRVIVPVGVAYGSDVDKVESLLLSVARANALALKDPEPRALFLGFGDSALSFELRVYIGNIDHLLAVRHQLHGAIAKAFAKAGVEIAFPQMDLHLRDAKPLEAMLERRRDAERAEMEAPEGV
ncbi:MAG: mechanosensitive ion channel domain-containing protein [Phycisphaerales bacterium JB039]